MRRAWVKRDFVTTSLWKECYNFLLPFCYKCVTFCYHWCCSLPDDEVQKEKAVGLDCFQNRSRQSLTLRPSFRKTLLLLPHTWDCAKHFSWYLCSVSLWKELLNLEGRNVWAKFGSLGNLQIWLDLKLDEVAPNGVFARKTDVRKWEWAQILLYFCCLNFCVLKVMMLSFTWSCFLCVIGIWLLQVRWSKHGTLLWPLWRLVKSVGLHVNQNMPMVQLAALQRYLLMLHWFLRWEMVTKTVCLKKMCDAISFQNRIVTFSKENNMVSFG